MNTSSPSVRSFPEKITGKIPLPYWLTWIIIWEVVFLVDYLYSLNIPGGHDKIGTFCVITIFFALLCTTIIFCSKTLTQLFRDLVLFIDHDADEFREWYRTKLHSAYEGVWPLLTGLLFVLLEEMTIRSLAVSYTPDDPFLQAFRTGYRVVGFFFLGVALWALISMLLMPLQLIRFKIKVSLNQLSGHGLQALGAAYFKMSMAITASYVPIVLAAILAGEGNNMTVLVWEGIGALFIFGFFLLPQIGIHRIMTNEKDHRILSLSRHLEDALEKSIQNPSTENMQRLKELFELQGHLKNMNEWPFNVHMIWQLVSALLIPLLLAVLEIVF